MGLLAEDYVGDRAVGLECGLVGIELVGRLAGIGLECGLVRCWLVGLGLVGCGLE